MKSIWNKYKDYFIFAIEGLVLLAYALFLLKTVEYCRAHIANPGGTIVTAVVLVAASVAVAGSLLVFLKKEYTEKDFWLIMLILFIVRILHQKFVPEIYFQNDLGFFEPGSNGHLGYIYILYKTGRLPNVNPMESYELYHPPVHYVLSALYLRFLTLIGKDVESYLNAAHYLRTLPLVYNMGILFFTNLIAKKLGANVKQRIVVTLLIGLLPYQILLSAALNNDALAVLFSVIALYCTLEWYEKPTIPRILSIAVFVGLAMTTKISTGMIAPGIGAVMLMKVFQNRKDLLRYVKQFAVFAVVVFPLGMWYAVMQFVRYRMPFAYAPDLPADSAQSLRSYTLAQRLFDFDRAFEVLHLRWGSEGDFVDHNFFAVFIKYAVFGESSYTKAGNVIHVTSVVEVVIATLLFLLLLAGIVLYIADGKTAVYQKVLVLATIFVNFGAYLSFCVKFPYVCAMNIRYVMVPVYFGTLAAVTEFAKRGSKIEGRSAVAGKVFRYAVRAGLLIFVVAGITHEIALLIYV